MQLLKVVLDLRIHKSSKQNDKSTWCIPSFVSSNRFLETFFFRRFCMAAVVSYIFIVTKIVVSVVTKTTATCVYFIQIRHIFNNWGTDLYNTQTEAHTSTIHKYHYFMFEISVHRLWTQRFLVWGQRMKRSWCTRLSPCKHGLQLLSLL